jgi:hypothetical protein
MALRAIKADVNAWSGTPSVSKGRFQESGKPIFSQTRQGAAGRFWSIPSE